MLNKLNNLNFTNKQLALAAWAIAAIYLVNTVLNLGMGIVWVITQLFAVALQCLIAYAVQRDRNDTFTLVTVIIFAVTSLGIPAITLIALVLCIKYVKNSEKFRSLWFLPGVVTLVFGLINLLSYFSVLNLIMVATNTVNYLMLGYWMCKGLGIVSKDTKVKEGTKSGKLAYYTDLYNRGAISEEEFAAKKAEIENQ